MTAVVAATLNIDGGGRINFISSVTGTVSRIRAIFRGEKCLGSW